MPNNLTTRTQSLLETCDKATPGPLRVIPLLPSADSSWSIVTGSETNPSQIADVFGQINWGEGDRQDAQGTAEMFARLHNEAPALLRDLLARVAFLEAALGEAKTFFYEDEEWIKHRGYDCEPGTMPNLAKWLQEGE